MLQLVKEQLLSRGAKTIRGLSRTFRQLDSYDGNNKVDAKEFLIGLNEAGCKLSQEEATALHATFDKDHDGTINFDEFLIGVRGQLNAKRQCLVDKAFLKFDKDGNGCIEAADLRNVYNGKAHPKVISGDMTEDEVFLEFLQNFGDRNKDGKLERSEWNDYYGAVSSNIDNDDHFVQLMRTAWKLD